MHIPFLSGKKTSDLEKRVKELEKIVLGGKKPIQTLKKIDKKTLPPLSLLSIAHNGGNIPYKWLIELSSEQSSESELPIILGVNEHGKVMSYDLTKAPHILVGGATESGKTLFLVSIITSLLFQKSAEDVRFIIVDPKRIEMPSLLNKLPHLLTPIIVDAEKALKALRWTIGEMDYRYKKLASKGIKNIVQYNQLGGIEKMPYIVFIIDELADLMIFAPRKFEEHIIRLAQMSRAVGIHLVLSTQRPIREVFTPMMRANIPTRIAFNVSSKHDSKVILEMAGAEELKEPGDMLFLPHNIPKPIRVHTPFITEQEFMSVIKWIVERKPIIKDTEKMIEDEDPIKVSERDPLFNKALQLVLQFDKASASLLQRRLIVGYARAAQLLDELEEAGIVGPANGSMPREVLKH